MRTTFEHSPHIQCPICEHRWELSELAAAAVKLGDTLRCPGCEAEIECSELRVIRKWEWAATAQTEAAVLAAVKP